MHNNKVILTYGSFDLFHVGHLNILKRAKELGQQLIVGVSTDEFNNLKGKKTIIPYNQRAEIVKNIVGVDFVIPENSWEQKKDDILKYNVSILVMGDDWNGKFDMYKNLCEVKYLTRTSNISSTQIKQSYKYLNKLDLIKLNEAITILGQITNNLK